MVIYGLKGGYFMSEEMLMIGNIAGMILQSLYISYFIYSVKGLKKRKILFFLATTLEFFALKFICNLNYTVNFEIMLGIFICFMLKFIYKDKARITDFITYIISLVLLGIVSIFVSLTVGMNIVGLALANIIPILLTYILRHKLTKIDVFYTKFWNRHNNKKMLKSITIRGISTVMTIITFVLLHFWLIYGIFIVRR